MAQTNTCSSNKSSYQKKKGKVLALESENATMREKEIMDLQSQLKILNEKRGFETQNWNFRINQLKEEANKTKREAKESEKRLPMVEWNLHNTIIKRQQQQLQNLTNELSSVQHQQHNQLNSLKQF